MGENSEVQAEEIEALEAIYPDEFESISSVEPYSYKVHLVPNPGQDDNHVAIDLVCNIPPEYPSEVPDINVEIKKGLGSKHKEELMELINATALENLGMPSIYTIAEVVREWLIDNNVAGQDGSMYADMMRRMQQKDIEKKKKEEKAAIISAADSEKMSSEVDPEEEERMRKRQAGHAVTVEVFHEWKKKFDAERRALKIAREGAPSDKDTDDRPTGKQLFLSNRAGLEEALIAAGEQETGANIAAAMTAATRRATGTASVDEPAVEVKEDLFLDDVDDDDLDELLDDDDV